MTIRPVPTSQLPKRISSPLPNGLVGHRDPAFGEKILDIAETQAKTKVEPHRVTKSYRTVERSGSCSALSEAISGRNRLAAI